MLIYKKLLIASLALSVNFTCQISAMRQNSTIVMPLKHKLDRVRTQLFNDYDGQELQGYKDFLAAVYAKDKDTINDHMCKPALDYLFNKFIDDDIVAQDLIAWARENDLDVIAKKITLACAFIKEMRNFQVTPQESNSYYFPEEITGSFAIDWNSV